MRNIVVVVIGILGVLTVSSQSTSFIPTNQKFKNGEVVYNVQYQGSLVGEFWPVHGINLVTSQIDSVYFTPNTEIADIQSALRGVATAPDGMTTASAGMYTMERQSAFQWEAVWRWCGA